MSAQFEDAGLHPVMLQNIELCGYEVPTPIQAYVLPSVFKTIDIIGIAQTGEEHETSITLGQTLMRRRIWQDCCVLDSHYI